MPVEQEAINEVYTKIEDLRKEVEVKISSNRAHSEKVSETTTKELSDLLAELHQDLRDVRQGVINGSIIVCLAVAGAMSGYALYDANNLETHARDLISLRIRQEVNATQIGQLTSNVTSFQRTAEGNLEKLSETIQNHRLVREHR